MTDEDDSTTTSSKTRWEHTGTIASMMVLGTMCATVGVYVYRGTEVPLWLASTFALATLATIAWNFGKANLKAAKDAMGEGGD